MAWPRYPAYRDSGVAWLGEVPVDWEVIKLKRIVEIAEGQVDPASDDFLKEILIAPNHIESGTGRLLYTESAEEQGAESGKYCFSDQDVLYSKIRPHLRKACYPRLAGICSADMYPLRPKRGLIPKFLLYLLICDYFSDYAVLESMRVAMPKINRDALGFCTIALPPSSDQHAIATILDRGTAHIDALIARKERLIALLQEKRAALIGHAVTKGLDPSAPMKDSGIAWLGEVPAHWNVVALHSRYHVQLGKMLDGAQITGEHLAPYLRNVDVQWDSINISALPEMDFSAEDRQRFALRNGDLLVCEGGEVGRTAIWKGQLGECFYQKALHRVRPIRRDASRYLYYCMVAAANMGVFEEGSDVSTIGHLTAIKLRKHRFPFPQVGEQIEIANHLDRETRELNTLISIVQISNDLLKEYRTALISAAVTGKIDVRGEVPA